MNAETAIQNAALIALTRAFHPLGLFWRQNAGKVRTDRGAFISLGPTGIADIVGVLLGRSVFVEIKTETGRQRKAQRAFQAAIERAGAIYVLARSAEEAVEKVMQAVAPTAHERLAVTARISAARPGR